MSQQQPASPGQRKLALLVGVNHYKAKEIPSLEGPVNDVHRMQALLVGKFGFAPEDVTLLTDEQATHAGIVEQFRSIAQKANPGDIVIFHFSGHGSQMMDDAADSGWDETIVPSDSRLGDVFDISDKELNRLIGEIVKKTPFVTVILDSCHSGTGIRDVGPGHASGVKIREIPRDKRRPRKMPALTRALPEARSDLRPLGAKYVLISATASFELANETTFEGTRMGALSYFLTRHLESSDQSSTYRDIVDQSAAELSAMFPTQHPQLEGASDTVIFGVKEISPTFYFPVVRVANGIGMSAGSTSGLSLGSMLDIYPPGAKDLKDSSKRIATAKVTRVSPFDADLQKNDGIDIPIAARAVLRTRRFADSTIRLGLVGFPAPEQVQITTALRKVEAVELVTEQSQATLLVNKDTCCYFISGGDLAPLSPAIHATDENALDHLIRQVEGWSRWFAVSELNNANSRLPIRLSGIPEKVRSGERFDIKIENLSSSDLFVTLLDLSSDGTIAVVNPVTASRDILGAGRATTIGLRLIPPEGRSSGVDTFKVIASVRPIDPEVFTQGAVKAAPTDSGDPLARLLRRTLSRSRDASPEPLGEWATAQRSTTVSEMH
jgi:hypothetical protein